MAITGLEKHRECAKCHQQKDASDFISSKSKFMPGGRSIYCIDCLERMIDPTELDEVDKLFQWLDLPFIVEQWTRLYRIAGERCLHLYIKAIEEGITYKTLDWSDTNHMWKVAMEENSMIDNIDGANEAWLHKMSQKWPSDIERTTEDYHYLENLYSDLCSTQNLITATQRDDAKRLCEIGLLINKKIRSGLDAKNEMAMYHNIIKAEGFEPKNSKNIGDFDSAGEVYVWLAQRGWKPNWHVEPKDDVDFTLKATQTFLKRLIQNESTLGDQVESKRQQIALAEKLEETGEVSFKDNEEEAMNSIIYEGDEDLADEFEEDDEDCLN